MTQYTGAGSASVRPNTGRERYRGPAFDRPTKAVLVVLPVAVVALGFLLFGWPGVAGGVLGALMADLLIAALRIRS